MGSRQHMVAVGEHMQAFFRAGTSSGKDAGSENRHTFSSRTNRSSQTVSQVGELQVLIFFQVLFFSLV